jgi:hypothetical protein
MSIFLAATREQHQRLRGKLAALDALQIFRNLEED